MVSEGFQRGLKPRGFRGVSEGSETVRGFRGVSEGSETIPFFKKRFQNGFMIHLESYGGSKLDDIGSEELFCYIWLLQGHSEASSDGFRGGSEGSETFLFLSKRSEMAV